MKILCEDSQDGMEATPQGESKEERGMKAAHGGEGMEAEAGMEAACNTPGVIVLINLPCHHNASQSIPVRLTLLCIN
jgi:hypothetical protein